MARDDDTPPGLATKTRRPRRSRTHPLRCALRSRTRARPAPIPAHGRGTIPQSKEQNRKPAAPKRDYSPSNGLMDQEIWLGKQKFSLADQNFGSAKQDSPKRSCKSGGGPRNLGSTDTKSGRTSWIRASRSTASPRATRNGGSLPENLVARGEILLA